MNSDVISAFRSVVLCLQTENQEVDLTLLSSANELVFRACQSDPAVEISLLGELDILGLLRPVPEFYWKIDRD